MVRSNSIGGGKIEIGNRNRPRRRQTICQTLPNPWNARRRTDNSAKSLARSSTDRQSGKSLARASTDRQSAKSQITGTIIKYLVPWPTDAAARRPAATTYTSSREAIRSLPAVVRHHATSTPAADYSIDEQSYRKRGGEYHRHHSPITITTIPIESAERGERARERTQHSALRDEENNNQQ